MNSLSLWQTQDWSCPPWPPRAVAAEPVIALVLTQRQVPQLHQIASDAAAAAVAGKSGDGAKAASLVVAAVDGLFDI